MIDNIYGTYAITCLDIWLKKHTHIVPRKEHLSPINTPNCKVGTHSMSADGQVSAIDDLMLSDEIYIDINMNSNVFQSWMVGLD